ncbi:hypothetical protein NPIL_183681, partial [Nephila pilipes]
LKTHKPGNNVTTDYFHSGKSLTLWSKTSPLRSPKSVYRTGAFTTSKD